MSAEAHQSISSSEGRLNWRVKVIIELVIPSSPSAEQLRAKVGRTMLACAAVGT